MELDHFVHDLTGYAGGVVVVVPGHERLQPFLPEEIATSSGLCNSIRVERDDVPGSNLNGRIPQLGVLDDAEDRTRVPD